MSDVPALDAGYEPALAQLLQKLQAAIFQITQKLETGDLEAAAWQDTMEQLIARYSTASYMAGAGTATLTDADLQTLAYLVQTQFEFLDNFTLVIASESEFRQGWWARSAKYADSIVQPYWKGRTKELPLPALPGEGTMCKCHCKWRIVPVDEDKGDYDCFWELGPVRTEHCQICEERADEWKPLKIRDGRLVL